MDHMDLFCSHKYVHVLPANNNAHRNLKKFSKIGLRPTQSTQSTFVTVLELHTTHGAQALCFLKRCNKHEYASLVDVKICQSLICYVYAYNP